MTTREEFRQAVKDEYLRRLGVSLFDVAADVAERLGMLTEHPGPWVPGQDVTARLAAGEQAPECTILRDCAGDLYRVEADGHGTLWLGHGEWLDSYDWTWGEGPDDDGWRDSAPLTVATPAQIVAAGIPTGDGSDK